MSNRALLVVALLLTIGCDKPKTETETKSKSESEGSESKAKDKSKKDKDGDEAEPVEKKTKGKPKDAIAKIKGIGEIPPWAAESGAAKPCAMPAAGKKQIAALAKGDDDAITDDEGGKFDASGLRDEVAGGCRSAEHSLAEALNAGGFQHYKKKKYLEAGRWFRAALVVHPASATPRFNLACTTALAGEGPAAIGQVKELARAAEDGDADASNLLEKAKSDADLVSVRDDADFKAAVSSAQGTLVGPRKEPETAAAGAKLLPPEFLKGKDPEGGVRVYKPALLEFWTWRPAAGTELLVATVVHDPASLGKPKGDLNTDYGGIAVFERNDDHKLKLLHARKTGEVPPRVAGKGATIVYSFELPCGDLHGTLTFASGKVSAKEKSCSDLGDEPAPPPADKKPTAVGKKPDGSCLPGWTILGPPTTPGQDCYKQCKTNADCGAGQTCNKEDAFGRGEILICDKAAAAAKPSASVAKPAGCKAGTIPAGPGGACVKQCLKDTECGAKQKCLPTQYEDPGAGMVNDHACVGG